ncbi:uncharacterized protein PG986_000588 [Apiospora aurea]|uniref:Uncharacterized protein n=1 Tax=Apiospora aurea TaxID=335848 RepID=A0ABR1QUF4_9PEZI
MAFRSPIFQSFIALVTLVSSALCVSCVGNTTSPNPVAQQYPNLVSGSLNGTTLIVPIPLEQARGMIPKEYVILEKVYRGLIPLFPDGYYPLMVTTAFDHDLKLPAYNVTVGDFSSAIDGSRGLGLQIWPAKFDPPCDPYKRLPDGSLYLHSELSDPAVYDARYVTVQTQPSPTLVPFPLTFIRNVTNQPTFANTSLCDNYIRLYNTSNSAAPHAPQPVVGNVTALLEPLASNQTWTGVFGWNYATAFIEPPVPANCSSLANFVDS